MRITSSHRLFLAATLLLALCACKKDTAPEHARGDQNELLIEEARIVLEAHCGQCHIGTYDSALPGALAIFDLAEPDWNEHIAQERFDGIKSRIDAPETIDGEPSKVTPGERALIADFIGHELAARSVAVPPLAPAK